MGLGSVLIIRPGALGDAILTLPALRALELAGAESLTILGTLPSWQFVRHSHAGLRVRDFSSSVWLNLFAEGIPLSAAARAALARVQRAVVYLTGETAAVRSALNAAGVKEILCAAPPTLREPAGACAARHAAAVLVEALQPWVERQTLEQALRPLDQTDDAFLTVSEEERIRALAQLGYDTTPAGGFFALHPGSGSAAKCWPAKNFAKLIVELACVRGVTPLVFFGPADEGVRQAVEAALPPGVQWEAVHNRPLREVLALLTVSRGFVGNDSGLSHLAARACKTWVLFGPTDPQRWAPLGEHVEVLRAPGGEMERLSVSEVSNAVA